jgi:ABC-2 type transport system ATP-binding protein
MQEEVLEVQCERPQDAMEEIEKVPGVREVALYGKGLHVVAEDGESVANAVRRLLGERGYGIARAEKISPSLEDVFVSLIEARDRADQPQREVRR